MPHQSHRGGHRGRRFNSHTYRDDIPDPFELDPYSRTHGPHRGRHQYGQNFRGGNNQNSRQRRNSTDGIHQYQSQMHPAIGHRYRDLKAKTHRLQTAVIEILTHIEELAPTEDHMDWSFSPGTVIYVPVPHPSIDLLSQTSFQNTFGSGPSIDPQPSDQSARRHNPRTPIDLPPVHPEAVGTTNAYYPQYPPTTVPLNGYDQTFANPYVYQALLNTSPSSRALSGNQLDGRSTVTVQTQDAALQAFREIRLNDAVPAVASTNVYPNGVLTQEHRPVGHGAADTTWAYREPAGRRVQRRVGDEAGDNSD